VLPRNFSHAYTEETAGERESRETGALFVNVEIIGALNYVLQIEFSATQHLTWQMEFRESIKVKYFGLSTSCNGQQLPSSKSRSSTTWFEIQS
jgi:hypothetical protein